MKVIKGNLWDFQASGDWIVIPTNGKVKANGEAVMGAGLALEAKQKFPQLPKLLGDLLKKHGNIGFNFPMWNLLTFPTKNAWTDKADLGLIEQSANDLLEFVVWIDLAKINYPLPIYIPKVGCGLGGLEWKDVEPILDKYFDFNNYVVVVEP